jgi:hypothetical protein
MPDPGQLPTRLGFAVDGSDEIRTIDGKHHRHLMGAAGPDGGEARYRYGVEQFPGGGEV